MTEIWKDCIECICQLCYSGKVEHGEDDGWNKFYINGRHRCNTCGHFWLQKCIRRKDMGLKADVFLHFGDEEKLDEVLRYQKIIVEVLKNIYQKEKQIMATLDETLVAVTDESTVADSLIALTTSIKAQLDTILAGGLTPAQQTQVDAIFSAITAKKQQIADAVVANTPAAAAAKR